jgi:hypothetical protein
VVKEIAESLLTCAPFANVTHHKHVVLKVSEVKPALHTLRKVNPESPLYFVGGLGLHYLLRYVVTSYHHPYKDHFSAFSSTITLLREHVVSTGQTIVFVGTMPVDIDIIHMAPEKHDWYDFYDLSLATQWAEGEEELFRHIVDPSECLFFLQPLALAQKCAGVRCDGMHFGAEFPDYDCATSIGLWELLLAQLLEDRHFNECVATSERKLQEYRLSNEPHEHAESSHEQAQNPALRLMQKIGSFF